MRARALRLAMTVAAAFTGHAAGNAGAKLPPPAPADPVNDVVVSYPGVGTAARPLLLFSGMRDGRCRAFEAHVGTSSASITLVKVTNNSWCPVELDVLASSYGAYGRRLIMDPPADTVWWKGVIVAGALKITLGPLTPVPVRVWIVADDDAGRKTANDMFADQLTAAASVFDELGPGIFIVPTPLNLTSGSVNPDCAASVATASTTSAYDAHSINVYYVKNYLFAQHTYAMNCWMDGHPDIVYISWGNQNTPRVALAHELGHALGLIEPMYPASGTGGGHTNGNPAFNDGNLMWTGATTTTNISVGQSYAMNFAFDSWFNRLGSSTPRPVSRACQDAWGAGVCADLTMFATGWPPP